MIRCRNLEDDLLPLIPLILACGPNDPRESLGQVDLDGDGVFSQHDCDDADAGIGAEVPWYIDEDGDGHGPLHGAVMACSDPGDRVLLGGDCDDTNPAVNPEASERCNGLDDDCDHEVDEGNGTGQVWYVDADGDGIGGSEVAGVDCDATTGWSAASGDCDDGDPAVHPGADELCADAVDNDCDGTVDDDASIDARDWYLDGDGDGHGDPLLSVRGCDAPSGYVLEGSDCDDDEASTHPMAPEICDGVDNNCDGAVDDDDPWLSGAPSWYEDADQDGFGTGVVRAIACTGAPGFASNGLDCVDTDAKINPSANEVCDEFDNDCDGRIDAYDPDLDLTTAPAWYPDSDQDGHGASGPAVRACSRPVAHVALADDCDDRQGDTWPGAPERCDGRDNDCDESVDEDVPTRWYPDLDDDGFGDPTGDFIAQCDPIDGRSAVATDCDDAAVLIHPEAIEACDGIDNDCDGQVDDADDDVAGPLWYRDADGDGHGVAHLLVHACDQPPGFVTSSSDCDDTRSAIHVGAIELCDDLDNDCDGRFDDADDDVHDASIAYRDADGDGSGEPFSATALCDLRAGWVWEGNDCNDAHSGVHPLAIEECNGLDDDCDALVDDADPDVDPAGFLLLFTDEDGDGYGTTAADPACEAGPGLAAADGDCDDTRVETHPGAIELCDSLDNSCNGLVDDGTPSTWYRDGDGDGHGDPASWVQDCFQPSGFVQHGDDCDDTDDTLSPSQPELCNGADDDCDGAVDDDDLDVLGSDWYADHDGDGYGSAASRAVACAAPTGFVEMAGDCQDGNVEVHPGAAEVCGGGDDDCDGLVDAADPSLTGGTVVFADADGDGYGDPGAGRHVCAATQGYVADSSDCDDTAYKVHPGAEERCGAADEDCDGLVDEDDPSLVGAETWYPDLDADGFGGDSDPVVACVAPAGRTTDATDCDDSADAVNPARPESPGNEVDENCDGIRLCFVDADFDGHGSTTTVADDGDGTCSSDSGEATSSLDCNDADAAIHPDAVELCGAADEDCDGLVDQDDPSLTGGETWYADADSDGFGDSGAATVACAQPSGTSADNTDCNDQDAAIKPSAAEIPGNSVDEDCSGGIDCFVDADGDGYGSESAGVVADNGDGACLAVDGEAYDRTDCDDQAPGAHPGAQEVCGGGDEDCDTLVDEADPDVTGLLDTFPDLDKDGFGDPLGYKASCELPQGFVDNGNDCDDGSPGVFHGGPCDDGDKFTIEDTCNAGTCLGVSGFDAECDDNACDGTCGGGAGCCADECDTEDCVDDCPAGCSCEQICLRPEDSCGRATCEPGSVCRYDMHAKWGPVAGAVDCVGATCHLDLYSYDGIGEMTCTDNAVCDLLCYPDEGCTLDCEDGSACSMECPNTTVNCVMNCSAPLSCPDGTQVCGRPC